MSTIEKKWQVPIEKVDEDLRQVTGWASVASVGGKDVVDWQDDVINESELEKMAHGFMRHSRLGKVMHDGSPVATVIESMVFTKEKQRMLGIELDKVGWLLTMQIESEDVWKRVKSGELKAFSIGGRGMRKPMAA